jgi:carbon-monoxide dehydrogenase iron sulfur subunit
MTLKINSTLCTGCRSCETVCSAVHFGEFNPARSRIKITNNSLAGNSQIAVCRSCKNPACVKACTYEACRKDSESGVIRIDYDACVGCFACVEACPFKANFIDPSEHVPLVCDSCGGDPVCAKFCYKQAITAGEYKP